MRKAKYITLQEFTKKMPENMMKVIDSTEKDIKVSMDWENFEYERGDCGYRVLSNGMAVMRCYAGGDWEFPVAFYLYWSGTKVRAYVPALGNVFNHITKHAYDDDEVPTGMDFDWEKMDQDVMQRIKMEI